ncbi:MAG: AMP-binding protein [Planctomycetota bacterium]
MEATLPQLLERQAAATPGAVAVVFEGQQLTYEELDGRANQVARFLIARGVGRGVPVGVLLDRSIEMVVAIWGLLKAGGAYVPLDTALPEARFAQIAEETAMPLLLTDRSLADRLPAHGPAVLWEDVEPESVRQPTAAVASGDVGAEDVAYVVFTSGSTGRPKGVLIPHRVFARCRMWALEVFGFTPRERFLLNFFRAPEELFYPHLIGATLVLSPPGAERDMRGLAEVVAEHRIHVLGLTPSLLSAFLDEYPSSGEDSLRHVFCAGEALPLDFQRRFFRKSGAHLYNFYGLAEAPYTLIWRCRPEDTRPVLPIGRPVDAKVLTGACQGRIVVVVGFGWAGPQLEPPAP